MDILHFSDLHLKQKEVFQETLIQHLFRDLEAIGELGVVPRFIVFSGDLVH